MDLEPGRGIKATAKPFSSFRERRQHKRHKKLLGAQKRHQEGRSRTTLLLVQPLGAQYGDFLAVLSLGCLSWSRITVRFIEKARYRLLSSGDQKWKSLCSLVVRNSSRPG